MTKRKKKLRTKYAIRRVILIIFMLLTVLVIGLFVGRSLGAQQSQIGQSNIVEEDDRPMFDRVSTPDIVVSSEPAIVEIVQEEVDPDSWEIILVSGALPIDESFSVELSQVSGEYYLDTRIVVVFKQMIAHAKAEGFNLKIYAAYRDPEQQEKIFNRKMEEYLAKGMDSEKAYAETTKLISDAWTSEHHTGLAVDISTPEIGLEKSLEDTTAFKWLEENAHKYGFILRYPKDKESITHSAYKPWHFRYVGLENAQNIFENSYALEEYLYIQDRNKNKEIIASEIDLMAEPEDIEEVPQTNE